MAAEEISLDGLGEQLEKIERIMFGLDKQVIGFTDDMTKLQKGLNTIQLNKATQEMEKLLNLLRNKGAINEFVEGLSHGAERLTWFMDVMSRKLPGFVNIFSENNGNNAVKMFDTMLDRIKGYTSGMKQAFTETNENAKQSMEVITNEFQRLKSLKAPDAISGEKLFEYVKAKENIDGAIEKVKQLEMELKNARNLMEIKGGGQYSKVVGDLKIQLSAANEEVERMKRTIKDGASLWLQYRSTIGDIRVYYEQIEQRLKQQKETLDLLKSSETDLSSEGKEILSVYEKQYQELVKLIEPYRSMIEFDEVRRANIQKAVGDIHAEQKAEQERIALKENYKKLLMQIKAEESSANTPLEKAIELDDRRLELMQQIIEKTKQASNTKSADALKGIAESVKPLENNLKLVQDELNLLYEKFPMVAQSVKQFSDPKMFNADGTLATLSKVQQAMVEIQNAYNMIVMNSGSASKQIEGEIVKTERQRVEELAKAYDKEQKIKDLKSAEKKIQEELLKRASKDYEEKRLAQQKKYVEYQQQRLAFQKALQRGDDGAIQKYLKQELSIKRLRESLNGIRNAQESCNHATLKGRQQYEKLEFEAKKLQKTLNQIQGGQSALNKMFVKMRLGVGQISTAFGVMGGIFGGVNLLKSLYKITSEFQLQQKALGAIINNAREANVLFKQMQTLAINSPLKFMDMNKYAKQLAAFRIETNKIYDSLKMLGDISVGVGVDMDRLILAYGQVKAANYLRGQELRQFSEAGVNILGGLQKYYEETKGITMTINEIFDSVSKRKVLFEDVDAVLHRMTESGGTFFNMQLVQSQTLYGQYQKLGDMFQIEMNKIGSSTSGLLLGGIKFLQFFIQNLRTALDILISIVSYKGMTRFVASFQTGALVSKEFMEALRLASVQLKNLVTFNFSKFVSNMRSASAAAQALKRALAGIGAAVAVFAISEIFSYYRRQKQAAKELSDELVELNRRFSDIRENEKLFSEKTAYKERLAVLQQLVEKAKEYNIQLEVAQNVNASNLDQVYNDALNQLKDFIGQVNYYKSVFSTDKTLKKDTKKAAEDYARLNTEWALAEQAAKDAYQSFLENSEYIPQEMRAFWEETIEMQDAYKDKSVEKEQENLEKYGLTSKEWEKEFARRINIISDYYKKTETLHAKGVGYGGSADPDAIFSQTKISYTFPDVDGRNNPLNESSKNIDKYVRKEKKAFEELTKSIKEDLEENGENLSKWSKMTEDELIKNIPIAIKAWEDVFKSYGITEEDVIKRLWAAVTETDQKIVFRAMLLYNNKETDLFSKEFDKDLKNLFGENGELEFDVKFNTQVFTDENEVKKQVASEDQLKDAHDRVRKALEGKNIVSGEAQEAWRKEKKAIEDEIKEYKKVEAFTGNVVEKMMLMIRVNRKLGESFYLPSDALSVLRAQLEQINKIGEKYQFEEKKTTHSRSQSMKSEYQSMIDFVRELNTEFDKLRKNFNEDDSARWAGATNRILSSFEEKFGAMPTKFKDAFQKTLSSIDFTTKEGTIAAEKVVKGLIDGAKDLTPKEKAELQRAWGEAVGQIQLDIDLQIKAEEDERLKAQVQKMFDDYNLTIELEKLGVDADEVGRLFNIDTKDLTTLEKKLEAMKEEFVGQNMEKEYRQFMRRIVEINDKANFEMAKKYVKYLREEYSERAKVELEYMKQRAEVYALPFDKDETMRILDNLQKETRKKLDEMDWKAFTGSDVYVELFEDLNKATIRSMTSMREQLDILKSSLSSLDPSNVKTLVEQIEKLDDELMKRDPFKALHDSLKAWRDFRKDEKTTSLINETLGTDGEIRRKEFRETLDKAIDEASKKVADARNNVNLMEAAFGAAKQRDDLIKSGRLGEVEGLDWGRVYDIDGLKDTLHVLETLRKRANEEANDEKRTAEQRTESQKRITILDEEIKTLSKYISSLEKIREAGFFDQDLGMSLDDIQLAFEGANGDFEQFVKNLDELKDGKKNFDKISEAAIEAGNQLADMASNMKNAYTSINEYLESIGVATDAVGEAWKEFGDMMFDTIIRALQAIPSMVASIVSAETAINAAAGWIGIIAEAITLIMAAAKSLAGLHDSYLQRDIDRWRKSLDRLEKTAERVSNAFDNLYDEDRLRQFDAALINTRELAIANLEEMMEAERSKKKSDQSVIDGYQDQIDTLNENLQEGIDKFYESLGGFGSAANMKSMVEEWTDAWYEAFKETGDGLSGLEDSFEEFFENIVKKTLMNNIMGKYFGEEFLSGLDTILGTEGGVMGNLDALNDWINQYHALAVQADEEMQSAVNAIQSVTGIGGGLDGLQASLQGMTEETADILAAYLNSVRFYVADNNQLLQNLLNGLTIDNNSNPMLQQLKIVAAQTTSINMLLDSVVHSGGYQGNGGGSYLKVHAILES